VSPNDVGYVDSLKPKRKRQEEISGELSTRPGLEVTVTRGGKIKIKKTSERAN